MFMNPRTTLSAALIAQLLSTLPMKVQALEGGTVKHFAGTYQASQPLGEDQARVVYYRVADGIHGKGAANVYLDQELVTSLLPGGYTAFCLRPGQHVLGAYLNDAYRYAGKNDDLYRATLKGGNTYYLKVREQGVTQPLPVSKAIAEQELRDSRAQAHLVNRASQVEECRHYAFLDQQENRQEQYVLMADQTLVGPPGDVKLSRSGKRAVKMILNDLQRANAQILSMTIEGHTDPLGVEADNQRLGQAWADAVRQALIDQGAAPALLKASSLGNRQLVKSSCYGTRIEQRGCYAPNRRVVVTINLQGKVH
ncbi:OmpA family protein [Pseudomonas chlororaphis]|uniref:OmpA family protein n=1 Tax=Pseudomonas chlororaphis subsp. aurantiaca TaxID=86192 RepID=A0AAJ1E2A3_9PSED|nr:OmpA family protein [Pseudomonas chlororaphis]MBU4633457.1 OmpA family protein [Pseudomonas chlororaphis subsp. aurantiaca]